MKSLIKFLGVVFVLFCVAVIVFHDRKTRAEAAAASDPLEIFYMYHEDESQAVWLRDRAEKFEALHPGLKVDILFAGRDVLQKLRPRILMGNPPDIIEQGGDQLRPLMEVGLFEPLDAALRHRRTAPPRNGRTSFSRASSTSTGTRPTTRRY